MKKVIYYISLFIAWLAIVIALAFILVICGVIIPTSSGLGYALGSACAHPQLWIISAGITMLIRPILHKAIFQTNKNFKKTVSLTLIAIGFIWLTMNLGAKIYHQAVEKAVLERLQENEDEIIDYVPGMFDNTGTK